MKINANTIEELFSASGKQEADLREIDQLIVQTAPELKRQLFSGPSITMLGYGEMTWMNKSSSGVWPLISVAPQKGNISIYMKKVTVSCVWIMLLSIRYILIKCCWGIH